jgi:hypothetical protein
MPIIQKEILTLMYGNILSPHEHEQECHITPEICRNENYEPPRAMYNPKVHINECAKSGFYHFIH